MERVGLARGCVVNGHDSTVASLKRLYCAAGILDASAALPTELARTLDEAEDIIGHCLWEDIDRIGIDRETPAPSAEALARLVAAIKGGPLAWRAPEVGL